MVERAVGAQLAHVDAFIGASSRNPPFMISWKRLCCSICSEKCRVLHALVSCAGLSFDVSARFGSRRSLSHPLRGPPIARLSALLSLPCASAAVPLSPCSVSALMVLCQISLCYVTSLLSVTSVSLLSCVPSLRLLALGSPRWLRLSLLLSSFGIWCLLFLLGSIYLDLEKFLSPEKIRVSIKKYMLLPKSELLSKF